MNKKPEKNEPHTQDETQLSPEEIRMFRHFLKVYVMKSKKIEKGAKPATEEDDESLSTEEILIIVAVVLFVNLLTP